MQGDSKLIEGRYLEMSPRGSSGSVVGRISHVLGAVFVVEMIGTGDSGSVIFRTDENEELAVRLADRSVWEMGRSYEKFPR